MSLGPTVTFNGNGGGTPSPSSVAYTLPCAYGTFPTVARAGYSLVGWFTAASDGTRVYATDAVSYPPATYTLYAQWVADVWELTDDGEWVYVDAESVQENLPAGLAEAYALWLDDVARLARLSFVVNGVVQDFRKAVAAASHSVGSGDASLLPLACLRSAQMMIWYFLGLDCGYADVSSLANGWKDAEVYLRSLYTATRMGDNRFAEASVTALGTGLPRYTGSPGAPAASSGASYSGGSGSGGSYSGGGYISLGL